MWEEAVKQDLLDNAHSVAALRALTMSKLTRHLNGIARRRARFNSDARSSASGPREFRFPPLEECRAMLRGG